MLDTWAVFVTTTLQMWLRFRRSGYQGLEAGTPHATPRPRHNFSIPPHEEELGKAPWHLFPAPARGGGAGTPGVQAAGRPEAGGAGGPASSGKAPRAGQRPGEEGQARGPAEA